MESISLIGTFLSGSLVGGFLVWWMKFVISERAARYALIAEKQREALRLFLSLWQQRLSQNKAIDVSALNTAITEAMLWCPDETLYHLGEYARDVSENGGPYRPSSTKAKEHFSNALMSIRKALGLKPRRWDRIRAEPMHALVLYAIIEENAAE